MRKDTSGLLFTKNKDGSIIIEVADYGVDEFDGGDWECRYDLTKDNADRLFAQLKERHSGTQEEMLVAEFGKDFDIPKFQVFCKEYGIQYSQFTWCG